MPPIHVGEETRLERLEESLTRHLEFDWKRLAPFRDGVDAWVDLLELPGGTKLVVKSPKFEAQQTRYNGIVEFGAELPRQLAAAELLEKGSVPTPRILAHHSRASSSSEPSWLVMELIEHEEADWRDLALHRQLGALARRIHDLRPSDEQALETGLIDRDGAPWDRWVVERILKRLNAARTYMELPAEGAVRNRLLALVSGRNDHAQSLLHLDLRPPNIAVRAGEIVSLFDLGNAIVGDSYLELARIRAANLLTPAFLEGYGLRPADLEAHAHLLNAYELDVAALLVVVSREEFDDMELHRQMSAHTLQLFQRLGLSE